MDEGAVGGWTTDEDGEEVWVGPFQQAAPGPGPALDHPDTRAETTSRIRASVVLAVVALVLVTVCLWRVERTAEAADALRATGVRVVGRVTDVDGDDDPTVSYLADGEQRSEVVSVEHGDHREGDTVTVFYDRSDPSRMSIDDEDDQSTFSGFVTGAAGVAGAGGAFVGLPSTVRWWRVRRRLDRAPFEAAEATVLLGHRKRITVRVTVAGQEVVLRRALLLPPGIWKEVSDLAGWPDGPCWVARSPGRRCVLAAPGGWNLWRMTTPRPGRQARRWIRQDAAARADQDLS